MNTSADSQPSGLITAWRVVLRQIERARSQGWRAIVGALVVFGTMALLLVALLTPARNPDSRRQTPGPAAPIEGHYAPGATLRDLSGNQVALSSFKGKVVIVNFWYAACEPCLYEMPALQRYYDARHSDGLVVIGVDAVDDIATATFFVKRIGISYPILLDDRQVALDAYKVRASPSSYIVDRQGVIRHIIVGTLDSATLHQDIDPLLAK